MDDLDKSDNLDVSDGADGEPVPEPAAAANAEATGNTADTPCNYTPANQHADHGNESAGIQAERDAGPEHCGRQLPGRAAGLLFDRLFELKNNIVTTRKTT